MKILRKAVILFLMFTMVCGLCFAAPKKKDTLDAAIRETSDYLNSNIAKGSKIVILNIQSDSGALSEYIIDELISNAVNDRVFLVVDRQQLDAIRAEQNFQFSGEVDDKQALEIGKFFGAQTIVSGSMGMIGKEYRLRVRALEVQTALVQGQFNKNIAKSTLIPTLLASKPSGTTTTTTTTTASARTATTASGGTTSGGNRGLTIVNNTGKIIKEIDFWPVGSRSSSDVVSIKLNGNIANNQSQTLTMPKYNENTAYTVAIEDTEGALYALREVKFAPGMTITITSNDLHKEAPKLYKVGDTGPAGGIIFYDKRNNNNGWRYLEVAPVEAEFRAKFSIRGTKVENLQTLIGSGRRNTLLVADAFSKASGEWDTAAQKCIDLEFGGFKDWFLPSKDELDQMYGNLKRRNLGDFKDDWYLSSSTFSNGSNYLWMQNFKSAEQNTSYDTNERYVRPIRQVEGPTN